jgi:hypothetical protein
LLAPRRKQQPSDHLRLRDRLAGGERLFGLDGEAFLDLYVTVIV